ncbi:PAS domain S-box protein [Flavobacterium sp. ZB4R12]|uniref:PAS domain S-box protein n=1 Tax=Flavobacterium sp. ZB4R12 TaxID=3398732 RepID=UPI003AAD11F5
MGENNYKELFNHAPALLLVLDTNFTIIAVTDAFLEVTMTERKNVLDKNIFDVFPINPDDINPDGEKKIRASFNSVIKNKRTDTLPVQKCDIKKPVADGGGFEVRYWKVSHSPILDADNNVKYIIQRGEDITENQELISNIQELKKNNEKLTESCEFTEAIIDTIHETMIILNKDLLQQTTQQYFTKQIRKINIFLLLFFVN